MVKSSYYWFHISVNIKLRHYAKQTLTHGKLMKVMRQGCTVTVLVS